MANYINYILMVIGTFIILISIILIFLDKLKGEDIYFNIDVKEQELKKVMEDAEEIITELNYTSEIVVKDIEEKIGALKDSYRSLEKAKATPAAVEAPAPAPKPELKPAVSVTKKNRLVAEKKHEKEKLNESKLTPKQKAVFEYAAQGMNVTDIAKQMNIGQGEVLLILSLKNGVTYE